MRSGTMFPSDLEPKFGVCPKCGADTIKIEGMWVCNNCGYKEKAE